jgi:hypothetical protein
MPGKAKPLAIHLSSITAPIDAYGPDKPRTEKRLTNTECGENAGYYALFTRLSVHKLYSY